MRIPAFLYDNFRNILRKKNFSLKFAKKHSQALFHRAIIAQIFLSEEKEKLAPGLLESESRRGKQ